MKTFSFAVVALACLSTVPLSVNAQDDEARSQSGLPTFIGNRPGSNSLPGTDAKISGSFNVTGLDANVKAPNFTVAVLANGSLVSRQPVSNLGGFTFNNVPRTNVSIIVEVDGMEVTNYPIGSLVPPPLSNRQDIYITWSQIGQAVKRRNEVLTVLNSHPRSAENQKSFERALAVSKEKKPDAAIKLYKELLAKDGQDYVAWTELGNLYFRTEKYSDAEDSYNKAVGLKSDFGPGMMNLGKVFMAQKKFDAAVETLTKALAVMPDSPDANHYLGESYLQVKKGSKAVPLLNKAIELAPLEKAEIHLRLAGLYNAANVKDRAVAEYKAFLAKMPNHSAKPMLEKYIADHLPK